MKKTHLCSKIVGTNRADVLDEQQPCCLYLVENL